MSKRLKPTDLHDHIVSWYYHSNVYHGCHFTKANEIKRKRQKHLATTRRQCSWTGHVLLISLALFLASKKTLLHALPDIIVQVSAIIWHLCNVVKPQSSLHLSRPLTGLDIHLIFQLSYSLWMENIYFWFIILYRRNNSRQWNYMYYKLLCLWLWNNKLKYYDNNYQFRNIMQCNRLFMYSSNNWNRLETATT